MQIHELDNFVGALDSNAYLAIDNGSDTGKKSVSDVLADVNADINNLSQSLNDRIDNIIAGGSAPSASEIVDARLGYDGVTYPSLGAAIRGQDNNLSNEIGNIFEVFGLMNKTGETGIRVGLWESGGITLSGLLNNNNYCRTKDFLFLEPGDYEIYPNGYSVYAVTWDDQSYSNPTSITWGSSVNVSFTVASNKYMKLSVLSNAPETDFGIVVTKKSELNDLLLSKVAELMGLYLNIATSWTATELASTKTGNEYIDGTGAIKSYNNASWFVAEQIAVEPLAMYSITASANWAHSLYVIYDADMNVLDLEQAPNTNAGASIENKLITTPVNASYISVATIKGSSELSVSSITDLSSLKWSGKKWVCVGDSLTEENAATSKHYFDYISEETGIAPVNFGIGGTGYTNPGSASSNFTTRMASVPTDADVYTIFGSFNDYAYMQSNSIPIGDADDTGTSTLCGYINGAFDALFARVPLANLGVIAPCPWVSINAMGSNAFGANYTEALRACCARRSVPFLDLYSESGMRPWDPNFVAQAYTKDSLSGVHPDETGHKILSTKIKAFLSELLA